MVKTDTTIINYITKNNPDLKNVDTYSIKIQNFIKNHINLVIAAEIDSYQQFDRNFILKGIDAELDKCIEKMDDSELKIKQICYYLSSLIENVEKKTKPKTAKKTKTKANTNPEISSESIDNNEEVSGPGYVNVYETANSYGIICTSRRCKLLEQMLPTTSKNVSLKFFSTTTNSEKEFSFSISKSNFSFSKQGSSNNYIVNDEISQICKSITNDKGFIKELTSTVYSKIIDDFQIFQKEMECIIQFITLLDLVITKAYIAKKYNYCKPQIREAAKSFVDIKELRHCLIEYLQTNELYVSNDITIGDGMHDGMLLYGTNAVGKTSFIRSLGISIIMAQSGLYVPATQFIFKPYKYIFTRIIGNDNIFKGLSTFAVEMLELRTILRLADKDSLILGDELCSGTENTSAFSIFLAGIKSMHKQQSSFIFATHMHEITDTEEIKNLETVSLKHMSVIYDKEKDVLIYDRKLKDGPGNNMYGLEVCKSLKLPDEFLDEAYKIRMKYNPGTGSMLSLKTSHFNSKKIVHMCEKCQMNPASEVHHLQHQQSADKNGVIHNNGTVFNKNNIANLMSLCDECHDKMHKKKVQHKKVKTTKGYDLQEI